MPFSGMWACMQQSTHTLYTFEKKKEERQCQLEAGEMGLVVKSTGCSSSRSEFESQYPHSGYQLSVTHWAPGTHLCCTEMNSDRTPVHIKLSELKLNVFVCVVHIYFRLVNHVVSVPVSQLLAQHVCELTWLYQ